MAPVRGIRLQLVLHSVHFLAQLIWVRFNNLGVKYKITF
jgi:hypothetical protein